ncbi:uncharacterized protein TEOVI_000777500 [Trypanosoma equiperdum]|uniref:Uncharacterized protein n=2 Tax=Trypanozoon TaxID=39700 RepID=A0A1G4I456_TRYEQ|nr:hypothetical protein DPX39_000062000 [Trypanosoma brucei equiperdum]SCU66597.1 hypothetical protein, conserved [Trypanosoma equiperdum]
MQQPIGLTVQGLHGRSRQERTVQQKPIRRRWSSPPSPSPSLAPSTPPTAAASVINKNNQTNTAVVCLPSSPSTVSQLDPSVPSSSALAALEGPLPAEVREIIHNSCTGEDAELAERQARRLLSTSRRVHVYRAELQSAIEEVKDVEQLLKRHQVIQTALRTELNDLNGRIEQLLKERRLCEIQLQQQEDEEQRRAAKLQEANMRVDILRSTIDKITNETLAGHVLLQKLVPNLHVNNYLT